jgi:hypothetical protein
VTVSGAIPLKDLAPLMRKLGKAAPEALKKGLLSGALRSVVEMQKRTTDALVFDRGGYRRSWKATPTASGALLFNDAPYSPIIEEGRRPGARPPPSAVIERWAKRKLALSDSEAKAAAFPIARAIGKRGIAGKHLLRDALPALIQLVTIEARNELQRALAAVAGGKKP